MGQFTSFIYQPDRIFFGVDTGCAQGGIFTQAVAGTILIRAVFFFNHRQTGQVDRRERRLEVDGHGQLLHGSLETEFGYIDSGNFFSHVKNFANDVILPIKFLPHAHTLGPLAREQEGDLFHNVISGLK
jgi:hypothetical protein